MPFDPREHHRRSIRLPGYDYTEPGGYFVTVVVQHHRNLLGNVTTGCVTLTPVGEMVKSVWEELPQRYPGVDVDAFVVMPNHIHGIVLLLDEPGHPRGGAPTSGVRGEMGREPQVNMKKSTRSNSAQVGAGPRACPGTCSANSPLRLGLPDVIHRFKSLTTARYRHGLQSHGWPPFHTRFWQRNYYEHIIRDDDDLDRVRQYIIENPLYWGEDPENPDAQ